MQMLMLLLLLLLLMLLQVRLHPGKVILVLLIAHQEVALLGTILASAQLLLLLRLLGTPNGSPGIGLLRDGIVSWVSTKLNWPGGLVEALLATALIG